MSDVLPQLLEAARQSPGLVAFAHEPGSGPVAAQSCVDWIPAAELPALLAAARDSKVLAEAAGLPVSLLRFGYVRGQLWAIWEGEALLVLMFEGQSAAAVEKVRGLIATCTGSGGPGRAAGA